MPKLPLIKRQEALIASLKKQPLLIVIRLSNDDFKEIGSPTNNCFCLIEKLNSQGVRHIEIAWSNDPRWFTLINKLRKKFKNILFGVASINTVEALKAVADIEIDYAMSPFWDRVLQQQAINLDFLLIPGIFSPSEIHQASSFGCRLIKLFPASTLGINYLKQVKESIHKLPFIIAAGGLQVKDLKPWISEGYGAITLGRGLIKNNSFDPKLGEWLAEKNNESKTLFLRN